MRLDFKGPAPSLTQAEHEKFRRQQAPTIVFMFWTNVPEKKKGPIFSLLRKPFNCRSCVSFSPWQVFRSVLCFAEVDKNPPIKRKHPKAAFAKFGPECEEKTQGQIQFLKILPKSCLNTRLLDETPCIFFHEANERLHPSQPRFHHHRNEFLHPCRWPILGNIFFKEM